MLNNLLPTVMPATEAGNPLLPPTYDIVWSGIIFVIILAVVAFVAMPKYDALADQRAQKLQEGLDATQRAKTESAAAADRIESELATARKEAGSIRDKANLQAEDIISRAQAKAEEDAKRILDNAQRQIAAERAAAESALRKEVGELATQLADKIVGEHLKDEALSARVVDRFLDDLDKQVQEQGQPVA